MTAHGFRLFRVSLRLQNGRKAVPFTMTGKGKTWSYGDHLHRLWTDWSGFTVRGVPRAAADETDSNDRTKPVLRVEDAARLGSAVLGNVRYGRRAAQDIAMGDPEDQEQDVDIQRANPSRSHRAALVLPHGEGPGVLAVEVIGRSCPVGPLVQWSGYWSERAARDAPHKDGSIPAWWRLHRTDLGDEELLSSFMAVAEAEEIKLKGSTISHARLRGGNDISVSVSVNTVGARRQVTNTAKEWRQAVLSGQPISSRDAAAQVAALFGADSADVEFDDAVIVLRDNDGQVRNISTSTLSDVFTYWIDDTTRPDDLGWRSGVRGAVERMAASAKLDLDWTGWPAGRT